MTRPAAPAPPEALLALFGEAVGTWADELAAEREAARADAPDPWR